MFGKSESPENGETMANGAAEEEQRQATPIPQRGPIQHSIISADAILTGDLISGGDVTVEGTVDGNIKCRCLTLSGQPTISGSAEAEAIHVCGTFNGEIHASKVVLGKTAKMLGDIFQENLEVHPGACFEGKVNRLNAQRAKPNGSTKAKAAKGTNGLEDADVPNQPAA